MKAMLNPLMNIPEDEPERPETAGGNTMERYADLMWSDDTLTYAKYDRKGALTSKYLETLRAMLDAAEPEDDDAPAEEWTKYEAISAAYIALIHEFMAAAKAYCNEARKSETFKEYEKEHWNDR